MDEKSQARLTDDYRHKCSELKNLYIAQNKTVRIRPPMRDLGGLRDCYDDVKILENGDLITTREFFGFDTESEEGRLRPEVIKKLLFMRKLEENTAEDVIGDSLYNLEGDPYVDPRLTKTAETITHGEANQILESTFDLNVAGLGTVSNCKFKYQGHYIYLLRQGVDPLQPPEYYGELKSWLFLTQTIDFSEAVIPEAGLDTDATFFKDIARKAPTLLEIFPKDTDDTYDRTVLLQAFADNLGKDIPEIEQIFGDQLFNDELQIPANDLIFTSIIENPYAYPDKPIKEDVSVVYPINLPLLGDAINYDNHKLVKILADNIAPKDSFNTDSDLLFSTTNITLEKQNEPDTVRFAKWGSVFEIRDNNLSNVFSPSLNPAKNEVTEGIENKLLRSEKQLHKVKDYPIRIIELERRLDAYYEVDNPEEDGTGIAYKGGPLQRGDIERETAAFTAYSDNEYNKIFQLLSRRSINPEVSSFYPTIAGNVKYTSNLDEFIRNNKDFAQMVSLLKPAITQIMPVPYQDGGVANQDYTYPSQDNPGVEEILLLPDFKIPKQGFDYPEYGQYLFSYEDTFTFKRDKVTLHDYDNSDIEEETITLENVKVNVFIGRAGPGGWPGHFPINGEKNPDVTSLENDYAASMPGVVLECQIYNEEDEGGIPIYDPYGHLNTTSVEAKLKAIRLRSPRYSLRIESNNLIGRFISSYHDPNTIGISESAKEGFERANIPFVNFDLSNSNLANADGTPWEGEEEDIGKIATTVRSLYFTYDYDDRNIKEYFNNRSVISAVRNGRRRVTPVTFIKNDNSIKPSVNYIDEIIRNLTVSRFSSQADLLYLKNYDTDITVTTQYDASITQFGTISLTEQGKADLRYKPKVDKKLMHFTFTNFSIPDCLSLLTTSFFTNSRDKLVPAARSYREEAALEDRRRYSKALNFFMIRFMYPAMAANLDFIYFYNFLRTSQRNWLETEYNQNAGAYKYNKFNLDFDLSSANTLEKTIYGLRGVLNGNTFPHNDEIPQKRKYGIAPPPLTGRPAEAYTFLNPIVLEYPKETPVNLIERTAHFKDNILYLSGSTSFSIPDPKDVFNEILALHQSKYTNISALTDLVFLRSGVNPILRKSGEDAAPVSFTFLDDLKERDNVLNIQNDSDGSTLIGLDKSTRSLIGDIRLARSTRTRSKTGTSSNIVAESAYNIYAKDSDVYQTIFSEEADGSLTNAANAEFKSIGKIDTVISLFAKHKVFLLHQKLSNKIYCLSAGPGRELRGISEFELPISVSNIHKVSEDRIILTSDETCTLHTMDFTSDENTDYTDQYGHGNTSTYEVALTTLPVFVLTDTEYSVFYQTQISRAVVALEGIAEFRLQVLDKYDKMLSEIGVRRPGPNIAESQYFSGPVLIKNIKSPSTELPKVRLVKESSKYIAFSSLVLDLGKNTAWDSRRPG